MLAVLVAVCMLGAGAYCAPAQAAQSARGGIPTADDLSLQSKLEANLDSFGMKELAEAEARRCDGVSAAYDAALNVDKLVKRELEVIRTEEEAIPHQALVDSALVTTRVVQVSTDVASFFATLPAAEAELAALASSDSSRHSASWTISQG